MLFPALTGVGLMALEFCTVKFVSTIILGEDGPLLGITDTTSVGSILEAQKKLKLVGRTGPRWPVRSV